MDMPGVQAAFSGVSPQLVDKQSKVVSAYEGWTVRVSETVRSRTATEPSVTFYKIITKAPDGRTFTPMKRYSMFAALNHEIQLFFENRYPHLASNIPMLPPKQWKFFVNHEDDEFVEERRIGLQNYLQRLLHLPRIDEFIAFHFFITGERRTTASLDNNADAPKASSPTPQ